MGRTAWQPHGECQRGDQRVNFDWVWLGLMFIRLIRLVVVRRGALFSFNGAMHRLHPNTCMVFTFSLCRRFNFNELEQIVIRGY